MPQIGPGKGDDFDERSDFGRERVTLDANDRFRFRTPTLRNVALTGPWGHAGAYGTLRAVVEHHFDPVGSLYAYDRDQVAMPSRPDLDDEDFRVMDDPARLAEIAGASEALTDPAMLDLRDRVPEAVPGGKPVFD